MGRWELEEFPPSQATGFLCLNIDRDGFCSWLSWCEDLLSLVVPKTPVVPETKQSRMETQYILTKQA